MNLPYLYFEYFELKLQRAAYDARCPRLPPAVVDSDPPAHWTHAACISSAKKKQQKQLLKCQCLAKTKALPDAEWTQLVHCVSLLRAAQWGVCDRIEARGSAPDARVAEDAVHIAMVVSARTSYASNRKSLIA